MNIMQIVSGTRVSGAITYCLGLTRELARRGHRITLVCKPGAWIGRQVVDLPIEVIASDLRRFPPDELRRLAGLARQRQVEVIHTHASSAHSFGVLLRLFFGIPCVATAHTRKWQLHWRMNDYVIACSEATRRFHRWANLVPRSRLGTLHGFVDPRPYLAVGSEERAAARAALGISAHTPLIGVIGKLGPRKGQINLVRALPDLLAEHPQLRVALIGDAGVHRDYVAQVNRLARQLHVEHALIWTGVRRDIPQVVNALDVVACPSLEETLPLVVLEAMATGKPVVASAVGGLPECILQNTTGFLIPPGDPSALAKALLALLADSGLRHRFGEAGRHRVLQYFSNDSIVPRIEAILERVARRQRAGNLAV